MGRSGQGLSRRQRSHVRAAVVRRLWPGLSEPLSGWRAPRGSAGGFRLLSDTQESPLPDHTELLLGLVECSPTAASGCPQNGQLRRLRQKSKLF